MNAQSVRRLREALGWSQTKLAARVGVSQPLVSAWESGRRVPRGPVVEVLQALARGVDEPTDTSPKRPREAILEAALQVLADAGVTELSHARLAREVGVTRGGVEHHVPTRSDLLRSFLRDYRARMEAETERLYREARRRHEPRPRRWAYLQQARHAPGSDQSEGLHRAAFLTFMVGDPLVAQEMRDWYARQVQAVLVEADTEAERWATQNDILALDAVWFFDLLGLQHFSVEERGALVDSALRRPRCG